MKKTMPFLLSFVFVSIMINRAFTMDDKASLQDWWRNINRFDSRLYVKQQQELKDSGAIVPKPMSKEQVDADSKVIAETFGILEPLENQEDSYQYSPHDIPITRVSIKGYKIITPKVTWRNSVLAMGSQTEQSISCSYVVSPDQWKGDIDTINFPENPKGNISVSISCYHSSIKAREGFLGNIYVLNSRPRHYLYTLYKLESGPGDVCLMHVAGGFPPFIGNDHTTYFLSDKRIIFFRGNVVVYLRSRYQNFGCMDLACRLDAFLVEQMQKKKESEKKE